MNICGRSFLKIIDRKKIMDALYYQLYRFYSRQPDMTPHTTTIWSIGAAFGFFFFSVGDWIHILVAKKLLWSGGYAMWGCVAISVALSYVIYGRKKRFNKIVAQKPLLMHSKTLSVSVAIAYMFICAGAKIFSWPINDFLLNVVGNPRI